MKEFDFELLDISTASNETISALGDALWHLTSARCEEEDRIILNSKSCLSATSSRKRSCCASRRNGGLYADLKPLCGWPWKA